MKIDQKFLKQLTGSLSKEKVEGEAKEFGNIFSIINKLNPHDNKIDIEEITKFAASIWQEDDGDGKISDDEIESYIQKNQSDFKNTEIKAKDIKKFLEFFVKNSDKTPDNNIRIDNGDGTYSIVTQREEFEERKVIQDNPQKDNNSVLTNKNSTKSTTKENNKKETISSFFEKLDFPNRKQTKQKSSNESSKPVYKTTLVSKGIVNRKINYNSNNQIITIEETRGQVTTITDAEGKVLRTITKNEGAKDTIKDYTILDDGTKEESVFYGENGVKDSSNPAYKNVYKNNRIIAKYEYDSNGQIIQRQNKEDSGYVYSITKYNNGVEGETVQLFTNTNNYADPNKVFDNIIDPTEQNLTGDCWLLDGLSKLSKKDWGRQSISDAIIRDNATGNITVKLKHAYGETKEFVITPQELDQAKQQTIKYYSFDLEHGDVVYIDGKRELRMSQNNNCEFKAESITNNITFVDKSGKKYVWSKNDLENTNNISFEGPKYSSGDLTVLATELAVEKSRKEVGLPLDGGDYQEVLAMFTDIDNSQTLINKTLYETYYNSLVKTNSEKEEANLWSSNSNKLTQHIKSSETDVNSQVMFEQMKKIMQNPDRYSCELALKMDNGGHAGQVLRFEQKDEKNYIVYNHSWDSKAEITEELESFVKNKLLYITIVEKDTDKQIDIVSDSQIGAFQMGNKSNRTNFASAIAILGQNPNFKPNIQKDDNNYVVTIKGEKMTITPSEIETARTSGRYSTKDDDIPLLELAVERYINKTRHNNTMYELAHTNLEDVKIQDILNLFSDSELKPQPSRSLAEAIKKDGLKFAIRQYSDKSIDGMRNTYYPIKEIKRTPDSKYLISVIQPEDTSVVVTYTEEEYRKIFNIIETYN